MTGPNATEAGRIRKIGPFWLVVPLVAALTVQWLRCLGFI
jgi:hypothetical protein